MWEELSKVVGVCVTIDLWTSRKMRSYLWITGHYVQDYRLVSAMLARKRLKGRHTAANIYSSYAVMHVLQAFNITNKICYIWQRIQHNKSLLFAWVCCSTRAYRGYIETDYDSDNDVKTDASSPESMKNAWSLRKVIANASLIVSHPRTSTHAADPIEHENKIQEVKMIRSILNIPKEKLDQLETKKVVHHDRTLLADLVKIISPFE